MTLTPDPNATGAVTIRRFFDTEPAAVYEAWTTPEIVRHWLHPGKQWTTPVVELDLRVGGKYRLGFQHVDEHEVSYVIGEYRDVEPGRRLVYTWTWLPPDPHAGKETLVTVTFSPSGDGTELIVRHEQLPDEEVRSRHEQGWAATLDLFAEVLSR